MTTHTQAQRISGPGELLQAVPYLLGFHPHRSLVLVGLEHDRLVVTARLDLADAGTSGVVAQTIEAMRTGGSTDVIAVIYDDDMCEPGADLMATVQGAARRSDCQLADVLVVAAGRWRSLACESADCCPPVGRPVPDEPSAFTAAATYAGVVALPDRGALEQLLAPLPDHERDRLHAGLERAERDAVGAVLAGRAQRRTRSLKRALFAAARAADEPGWGGIDADGVTLFGAALTDIALRDSVWMAVDGGRLGGRPLWRELARRLPSPYDAAPLFLYGWAAWRSGDGALAGIAADRAVGSDPGYSAADLLLAALARGVDPGRLPKLRLPRSA